MFLTRVCITFAVVFGIAISSYAQEVYDIEGTYIRSTTQEFLCEDGSEINIPFWIGEKGYQWLIHGNTLTISFKANIIGITVSNVSIDYQLTPIAENEISAVPTQTGVEDFGASEFKIRILENGELLAIRGNNPKYCGGANTHLYMTLKSNL